jgi:hypothetical protein
MRAEYDRCVSVLNAENELADKIHAMVMMVRRAVIDRSWADFEVLMGSLSQSGVEFEALEQEREAAFAVLAEKIGENGADSPGKVPFLALSVRLPAEERKNLTELYRSLKLKTLRVGIENNTLMNYLNEVRGVVSDFLAAAFPDRKGKLYTRQGGQVPADMRSIVLDRQF